MYNWMHLSFNNVLRSNFKKKMPFLRIYVFGLILIELNVILNASYWTINLKQTEVFRNEKRECVCVWESERDKEEEK